MNPGLLTRSPNSATPNGSTISVVANAAPTCPPRYNPDQLQGTAALDLIIGRGRVSAARAGPLVISVTAAHDMASDASTAAGPRARWIGVTFFTFAPRPFERLMRPPAHSDAARRLPRPPIEGCPRGMRGIVSAGPQPRC